MKRPLWTSHPVFVLLLAGLGLLGTYMHGVQALEGWVYDAAAGLLPLERPASTVAVAAVDEAALERFGPWPWSRARLAEALDRLRAGDARTVGLMVPLAEPQTPPDLPALRRRYNGGSAARALARLDTDGRLATAIARADNVVLMALGRPGAPSAAPGLPHLASGPGPEPPPLARLHPLLAAPAPPPLRARAPLARFRERTAGIGVVPPGQPPRRALLAYPVGEEWVPSFALAVAARAMRVPAKRVRLVGRTGVEVGDVAYATDRRFGFYPRPVNRDGTPVETFSLAALWDPGVEVAGKTVLIGPTAGSLVAPVSGPGGRAHAPVVWAAHAVDSLLEGHRITVPAWFHGAQRALILLVALYLALLPQRLHGRAGLFTALAIGLLALNAAVVVLLTRLLWLPITVPVAFLGVAQIALWGRFRLAGLLAHSRDEAARTHQVLGKTLQAQGRLEDAFEEFKQCPVTEEVLGVLYELGLDLERRRQFTKALAVYEYMGAYAEHRDIKARAQRLRSVTTPVPRASSAANAGTATVVMDAAGIEKPMLGRYRLEREIGRGAMGMVYLGKDPKIGRRVAIKTLALSEEFEGGQLEEVQKRFFREAAAAGRLNHPHIVTIYDVGEESDLAYIAMDYIEGDSLDRHTSAEQLLPVPEVLEIGAQVAEALGYAHGKQVVHRDVKPGNMLYDRRTRAVKVTDFGVAYLIDSSKTRTGTVLGSPSYMSPEQVAGDKLDGRSDLFSLGVTLYQLLTGRLPFQGESVANLMYRITNENPPDIRKVRSDLAPCVARVVHRALQKEASKRYAGGDSMAEALRRCRIEAMGGRAKDNRQ